MEHERDPRLDRLTQRLRDEGIPPERDLWPDIDAAIRRREETARRPRRATWWRVAAAAAALAIVVLGARALLREPSAPQAPVVAENAAAIDAATDADGDGMNAVTTALAELNEALATDPDNHNLTRLVLMVHRTRGELLRRTSERDAGTG